MTDDVARTVPPGARDPPRRPGARTHLGEFLHGLGRRAEALEVLRGITAGAGRDARKLRALADVLADFDYRDEAIAVLADARAPRAQ